MKTEDDNTKLVMADDLYWLEKGKNFIDDSLARLASEIKALSTKANAIEVTYTISLFLTIYFAQNAVCCGLRLFIYCVPILVFEWSKYWLSIAHIQQAVYFNYRSPDDIRRVYNEAFGNAYKNLNRAKWIYLIAISSAFVIIFREAMYTFATKEDQKVTKHYLTADWHEMSDTILIAGCFHGAEKMNFAIRQEIKIDTSMHISKTHPRLKYYNKYQYFPYQLGDEHLFFSRFIADTAATKVEFVAKYLDSLGIENALMKTIDRTL